MVVDDNPFNLETLKLMIKQQFNIDVVKAANGEQAVKVFREKNIDHKKTCISSCKFPFYDLIFMDLNMPVLDGYQATEQIIALQKDQEHKCSIVALTAYQNKEALDRCTDIGMQEVLNKPAKSDAISQVIQKYCNLLKAVW